jgi:hypothetical protein
VSIFEILEFVVTGNWHLVTGSYSIPIASSAEIEATYTTHKIHTQHTTYDIQHAQHTPLDFESIEVTFV